MAPIFRYVLLLSAVFTTTLSIPTTESQCLIHEQTNGKDAGYRTPFQKLRDAIIERIWQVPKKTNCHSAGIRPDHAAPLNFRTRYGKDVVLRFNVTKEDEAKAFMEAANVLYLDIWDHSENWVDVRIAKNMLPSFLGLLPPSLQNSHTPLMHDLAQAVYDTYPSSRTTESWRTRHNPVQKHSHDLFFQDYQPLSVLHPWMKLTASLFSNHVNYISIGTSAEGRDIGALRVGAPPNEQVQNDGVNARKTILVIGGAHAREWISTSTVAYLAYNFATRYGQSHSPIVTKILKHFDIVFVPTINPDGYEYTWTNDRLWRKNRQSTLLPFCPGIDLDRAFGYQWDGFEETDNPCTETYAGEHPFHAVEAKVLADWARNQTLYDQVVFSGFLDLHSYSQQVLYPFSYTCEHEPPNLEDLEEVASDLAKAFRLSQGHIYAIGSACESQFVLKSEENGRKVKKRIDGTNDNGGSALDYFYEDLRVRMAFEIKLRDVGTYGFLLPRENIVPTGRETYEALTSFGRYLLGDNGIERVKDVVEEVSVPEEHQRPDLLFRNGYSKAETDDTDDGDDEWERVYDAELRRRR